MSARILFWNSITGLLPFTVSAVVGFVMSPIMVDVLGNADYGAWELITGFVGYMGLLELGIGPAIVQQVAAAVGRRSAVDLSRALSTALVVMVGLGTIAALVLVLLSPWAAQVLGLDPGQSGRATRLFLVFAVLVWMKFPFAVLSGCLLGQQRHRLVNVYIAAHTVVAAVAVYLVLKADVPDRLLGIAVAGVPFAALHVVLYLRWVRRSDPAPQISLRNLARESARALVSHGVKNSVMSAAGALLRQGSPFVIAHVLGVGHVAYFVIAIRLPEYANTLLAVVTRPLSPYMSQMQGEGRHAEIRQQWLTLARLEQVLVFGFAAGIAWLGEPFLRRWMSPEFAERGAWALLWFALGLLVQGVAANSFRFLQSHGIHGRLSSVAVLAAPVALLLAIPLTYSFGIAGAAFAMLAHVVVVNVAALRYALREISVPWNDYLRRTALRFLVPLVGASVVWWGLRILAYPWGYPQLLVQGAVGALAYGGLAYAVALTPADRSIVRRLFGLRTRA